MYAKIAVLIAIFGFAGQGVAQDKSFSLAAPNTLVETGFFKHLLPRFSLKTGIKVTMAEDAPDTRIGDQGMPVFRRDGVVWSLSDTDGPLTRKFADWLTSDIGKRTIEAFRPDGVQMFSAYLADAAAPPPVQVTGDAALGEKLSLEKCGRCHVVSDLNRMDAIGSTPSFALLRTFDNWQNRFEAFFTLRPHPAFTQIAGVTEPFDQARPSPIVPLELTLDDIDAILAYVSGIAPAELGAPIQSQ